jgi:chemotaxis protein methyltransferase CheR
MRDEDCVRLLQWALPQLQMRWPGFRKVRKQVCKRIGRRLAELRLADGEAYRGYLEQHNDEWARLDVLCRVVVTRYYRDRLVFARLAGQVLPALARAAVDAGRHALHCWSIGSASGEEPYTLAILWRALLAEHHPGLDFDILGTEVDPRLLARSRRACYPFGTIRNLPAELQASAFTLSDDQYCLKPAYRDGVRFQQQDIRTTMPDGPFDLILCRNLVFTYFEPGLQRRILGQLLSRLRPGGWLLLGVRETLPVTSPQLAVVSERLGLYRRTSPTP